MYIETIPRKLGGLGRHLTDTGRGSNERVVVRADLSRDVSNHVTLALRKEGGWGHVQAGAVVRSIGYEDVNFYEEVYVGDQLEFHATLESVGNTSRRISAQTYKLATPATRLGVAGAKEGDMVWFDKPLLVSQGIVTLIVAKDRQRGYQPDGIVKDPWRAME